MIVIAYSERHGRRDSGLQRPIYFPLPSIHGNGTTSRRQGSLSRIPLTMSREDAHVIPANESHDHAKVLPSNNKLGTRGSLGYDPTYADPIDYGGNTGKTAHSHMLL